MAKLSCLWDFSNDSFQGGRAVTKAGIPVRGKGSVRGMGELGIRNKEK